MCMTMRQALMAAGLQVNSMLTDWSAPSVLSSHYQTHGERDRDGAERVEPCLSVMEASTLDAAVSNSLPENTSPVEERESNDG